MELEQASHIGSLYGDHLMVGGILFQELIKDIAVVQIFRNGDAQGFFGRGVLAVTEREKGKK